MSLHVGQIIKKKIKNSDILMSELAKKLHMSETNLYKVLRKESLETSLITSFSEILQYNFFIELAKQPELMIDGITAEESLMLNEPSAEYGNIKDRYHSLAIKYIELLEENKRLIALNNTK